MPLRTIRLSRTGRVTIPRDIRQALRLGPGDMVAFEVRRGKATLRRVESFDAVYHSTVSKTLGEWSSAEDDRAFRSLGALNAHLV